MNTVQTDLLTNVLAIVVCGIVGRSLVGSYRRYLLLSLVVGSVGALAGVAAAGALSLPVLLPLTIAGKPFPVPWAILGAAIFAGVTNYVTRPRRN